LTGVDIVVSGMLEDECYVVSSIQKPQQIVKLKDEADFVEPELPQVAPQLAAISAARTPSVQPCF